MEAGSKRKRYDKEDYLKNRNTLEQILYSSALVDLSDQEANITGSAEEKQRFVSSDEMHRFMKIAYFDCRTIKLINYNKPAISISYFQKHKYVLNKKPKTEEVAGLLESQIKKLNKKLAEIETAIQNLKESELSFQPSFEKRALELTEEIKYHYRFLNNLDTCDFAISNYSRYYIYSYINYKYYHQGGIESGNSHLIKHTFDKEGEIAVERTNVIFVDIEAITKPVPYDNKKITDYLATFPDKINCGTFDLYIKD